MSRKLAKIPDEKVFEIDGIKFTMARPSGLDTFEVTDAQKEPVKAFKLVLSRIKKIEGIEYEDGKEINTVDLPFDLLNALSLDYLAWYGEVMGNGLPVTKKPKK